MDSHSFVVHHTFLEQRGGAARVADVLHGGLELAGARSVRTFEVAQSQLGEEQLQRRHWRDALARHVEQGGLVHAHGSEDWEILLQHLIDISARTVITLHDAGLFTGACPYPLDCDHFFKDCLDPCPRKYLDSHKKRSRVRDLVEKLQPTLVSPSGWLKKLAVQGLSGQSVRVIPNGVEWPESNVCDKAEAKRRVGVAPEARLALFVAHGGEKAVFKSGDAWRRVWEGISANVPGCVAFIVGGEEHARQNNVVLWPYLDQPRLRAFMQAADVLLYPTRADNHPLVILEAMASHCPVISYAVGGVPEQIQHEQTGLLVQPNKEQKFIETAITLLNSPTNAKRLAKQAFEHGKKYFTSHRMTRDYKKLYK